jgi:predicted DNA-binding transcriptional regulator YafY
MQYGHHAEVLAPESLREACKEEAQKLMDMYENGKEE